MELQPFLCYSVITKGLNLSDEKYKLVYMDQYKHRKTPKDRWDNKTHTLQEGGKYYIYEGGSIFLIFYDHQDTESESQ